MRYAIDGVAVRALSLLVLCFAVLGEGAPLGETGPDGRGRDRVAARAPRFTVELRLEEVGFHGFFTEVSGLGSENEIVEFRDGADPNIIRKLPGPTKYSNIVLKRGLTSDASLWRWRQLVETGNIADARTNGTIVLLDRGTAVATWQFTNAWPSKISGPELSADGNDIAIEEIVIAHEGISRY